MNDRSPKCVPGCSYFSYNEVKHDKDCPFYNNSLSKMYDVLSDQALEMTELLYEFAKGNKTGNDIEQYVFDKVRKI